MRHQYITVCLVIIITFVGNFFVYADEDKPKNIKWEVLAKNNGLTSEAISTLKKNRLLITNKEYKQIFSAYLGGDIPKFITSDSVLNAYHVLYEESILSLENAKANQLKAILRLIFENLESSSNKFTGKAELFLLGKEKALLVIGIALGLMDDDFQFKNEKLDTILKEEIKSIKNSSEVKKSEWLGKPMPSFLAVDYSRFTPRGFYLRSSLLKRYFSAISWLQAIPFQIDKDEDLVAFWILGNSISNEKAMVEWQGIEKFFRTFNSFIGACDNLDLLAFIDDMQSEQKIDLNSNALSTERDRLSKKIEQFNRPLINDQVGIYDNTSHGISSNDFRIISAFRAPSAVLFQRTTDRENRPFPNGMEIPTVLGSKFARKFFSNTNKNLLNKLDSYKNYFQGESLYFKYLESLKALLDEPEPDAPGFMKGEVWAIKSCNAALAGWAQLSHTWALQSKQVNMILGWSTSPKCFVEPDPEFFSRMAELAMESRKQLKISGAFAPEHNQIISNLDEIISILEVVKTQAEFQEKISILPKENEFGYEIVFAYIRAFKAPMTQGEEKYFGLQAKNLKSILNIYKEGDKIKIQQLEKFIENYCIDLDVLWAKFEEICRRLSAIAHKQLRKIDLNKSEQVFLENYGINIAEIMFYGMESYLLPKDDSPRIVDVFSNLEKGKYLHVGVSRPRQIFVIYPWKGQAILCEGAVMPYYEYISSRRLDDVTWKNILDSDKPPNIPSWLMPIIYNKEAR